MHPSRLWRVATRLPGVRLPLVTTVVSVICLIMVCLLLAAISEERKTYARIAKENLVIQFTTCRGPSSTTMIRTYSSPKMCSPGFLWRQGGCVPCPRGTFSLAQWTVCEDFLVCDDMLHEVRVSKLLYTVGNWHYYEAEWKGYEIVCGKTQRNDVTTHTSVLQELQPHSHLLYPIGFCEETGTVAFSIDQWRRAQSIGSVSKLGAILAPTGCDNWMTRFQLCLDYVRILHRLHTAAGGPYVFCNSHSLEHTLSQFLISEDLQLLLANYDNLPQVRLDTSDVKTPKTHVRCSKNELKGDFVAPEQKWPFSQLKVFNADEQPGYSEKTDIWKIPDIVEALLNGGALEVAESEHIMDYLVAVHQKCKRNNPEERPAVSDVLKQYELVWRLLSNYNT